MTEEQSIMAWLERRLKWATTGTLPLYVAIFKEEWRKTFGTLDNIPQDFKIKVTDRYRELKEKEAIDNGA